MLLLIFLFLSLAFALLLFFIVMSAFITFLVTRVPFVPTPSKDITILAQHLNVKASDVIYDVGSGNGVSTFAFAKVSGGRVLGIERGLWMHLWALIQKYLTHSGAQFQRGNFFKISWTPATIIYCYLYPPLMKRIGEKAKQDLKSGSLVVSRDFPIPNLGTPEILKTNSKHEFYIYTV